MRRPRGPGGRFLTAEEIVAQKATQVDASNPDNDGGESEDVQPSPDSEQHPSPVSIPSSSYILSESPKSSSQHIHHHPQHQQLPMLDMGYHHHRHSVPLSQSLANVTSSHPSMAQYANHKNPIGHDPMPISTPYAVQMHHLPQRHHHPHSSYSPYAMYPPDPIPQGPNLRPHEMIHFGTTVVPSP